MWNMLIDFLNWIIQNIGDMLKWAILLLPKSPLSDWIATIEIEQSWLSAINYFIPVAEFIPLGASMLAVYGVVRSYWALLRIGKVVD